VHFRRAIVLLAAAGALALPAAAAGSITAATNAQKPGLKVDSRGYAEVSWTEKGVRKTLLIPPSGRYLPSGRISGKDVSRPTKVEGLPYAKVVRRTPDGRIWALQAWPVQTGGPVELRFSRWKGDPTDVTAEVTGARLMGKATYAGKGIYGTSPTTAGTPIRHFALVDCFRCSGAAGWKRLLGVRLKGPGGTFRLFLRPAWGAQQYRVSVAGPNRGWTYAPDGMVVVKSSK
jgi:hypothetical protein